MGCSNPFDKIKNFKFILEYISRNMNLQEYNIALVWTSIHKGSRHDWYRPYIMRER